MYLYINTFFPDNPHHWGLNIRDLNLNTGPFRGSLCRSWSSHFASTTIDRTYSNLVTSLRTRDLLTLISSSQWFPSTSFGGISFFTIHLKFTLNWLFSFSRGKIRSPDFHLTELPSNVVNSNRESDVSKTLRSSFTLFVETLDTLKLKASSMTDSNWVVDGAVTSRVTTWSFVFVIHVDPTKR